MVLQGAQGQPSPGSHRCPRSTGAWLRPPWRRERSEFELALGTDYREVISKARHAAGNQHESPWPIGWTRHQHNQGLKQYSTEAGQRRRHESTNTGNRLGSRQAAPNRGNDKKQSYELRSGRCGSEEKVDPVVEHYGAGRLVGATRLARSVTREAHVPLRCITPSVVTMTGNPRLLSAEYPRARSLALLADLDVGGHRDSRIEDNAVSQLAECNARSGDHVGVADSVEWGRGGYFEHPAPLIAAYRAVFSQRYRQLRRDI